MTPKCTEVRRGDFSLMALVTETTRLCWARKGTATLLTTEKPQQTETLATTVPEAQFSHYGMRGTERTSGEASLH